MEAVLTMLAVAAAIAAAQTAYPRFGWHTTRTPIRNKCGYHLSIIDENTATVYVDGTLGVATGNQALVDGIHELLGYGADVIPLATRRIPSPTNPQEEVAR